MRPLAARPSAVRAALARVAHGYPPDYRAHGVLIQHCADNGLLFHGQQLHARLVVLSVTPDNFLASKLLSFYSRAGRLREARKVFDDIPQKNLFAFNAMLLAYALHGRYPLDGLCFFSSLLTSSLRPDAITISAVLKSLSTSSSSSIPRLANEEVHCFVLRSGFGRDLFVSNGLITVYSVFDGSMSARKLFDEMPSRDVVSWNSMIAGYSQSGRFRECQELYLEMEKGLDGIAPNGVTVASVLHACSQLKDLIFGMGVHCFAVENSMEMDIVVGNSIVGFYAKCGSLEHARKMFDDMHEKDGVSYSAMITGYMSYGFVGQAMELFQRMVNPILSAWNAIIAGLAQNNRHSAVLDLLHEMQKSGFRPNPVTLSSVLLTISFHSNLWGAKQVHSYAISNDFDRNIYLATALIDAYAKSGHLCGAQRVFDGCKTRSVIVWTAIISAYAAHGIADAAFTLFGEMLDACVRPDSVTITAVLNACAHAGAVDEARNVFDAMLPEHGITPVLEHYACMVGVLSRAGLLQEAVEFVNVMPFEPNAKVWGSLLNGAAAFGDVKLGKFVFDRLFVMEPENTGNYIVMANLYSKAGKWEEAEMIRDKMRGVGLAKIPGCSWIEMTDGLKVFVASDILNSCFEEMYMVIEGLVRLMREEGYVLEDELDEESIDS